MSLFFAVPFGTFAGAFAEWAGCRYAGQRIERIDLFSCAAYGGICGFLFQGRDGSMIGFLAWMAVLARMDRKTGTVPARILWAGGSLCLPGAEIREGIMVLFLVHEAVAVLSHVGRRQMMGPADEWVIFFLALKLGGKEALSILFLGCLTALAECLLVREEKIPFLPSLFQALVVAAGWISTAEEIYLKG